MSKFEAAANTLAPFQGHMGWFSGLERDHETSESWETWNHWTGARDELVKQLQRRLTDEELTLLSLSLAFGPAPALPPTLVAVAVRWLWPDGNPRGEHADVYQVMLVAQDVIELAELKGRIMSALAVNWKPGVYTGPHIDCILTALAAVERAATADIVSADRFLTIAIQQMKLYDERCAAHTLA